MSTIQDFSQIAVVGIGLSFLIDWIKKKYGIESTTTKALTIGLSIVLGAGYFFLVNTPLWVPIIGILGAASTFYALILK